MVHHTDYSVYFYADGPRANSASVFDDVAYCFAGKRHRYLQLNITDVDSTGLIIATQYHNQFYKVIGLRNF